VAHPVTSHQTSPANLLLQLKQLATPTTRLISEAVLPPRPLRPAYVVSGYQRHCCWHQQL